MPNRIATGVLIVSLPGAAMLGGCATRMGPSPDRFTAGTTEFRVDWPSRPPQPTPLAVQAGHEYGELVSFGRRGQGLLYQLHLDTKRMVEDGHFRISIGSGESIWFTISGPARPDGAPEPRSFAAWSSWPYLFTTEMARTLELEDPDGNMVSFDLPSPTADLTVLYFALPEVEPIRGTVIMLASLDGMTAGERAILERLTDRGWAVVWTSPSLAQLRMPFVPPQDGHEAEHLVSEFARRINHNISERAYAIEAALGYLYERMPELVERPLLALGCSAGAINLPTVVARLSHEVDAAVLVGGGCDLYGIVTRSDLFRERLKILIDGRQATPADLRALRTPVLEQATLDPYHTALALRGTPVLMLHASFDRIVPADRGVLLYERLCRPERWSYPLGHLGLFFVLPSQADEIVDWMEEQAVATRQESPDRRSPTSRSRPTDPASVRRRR